MPFFNVKQSWNIIIIITFMFWNRLLEKFYLTVILLQICYCIKLFTCSGSDVAHLVDSSLGIIIIFFLLVLFLIVFLTKDCPVFSFNYSTAASNFFCFLLFCFLCCITSLSLKACSFNILSCFSSPAISDKVFFSVTGLLSSTKVS